MPTTWQPRSIKCAVQFWRGRPTSDRLCGQGDSEGALLTVATELADADPHAAHSAILYSLQARVDYLLGTHLPEQTCELAEAG